MEAGQLGWIMMLRLTAGILLLLVSAGAQAITWSPTNIIGGSGDILSLQLSNAGPGQFAIFEQGTLPTESAPDLTLARFDRVSFALLEDGTWQLANRAGQSLNLGLEAAFHFAHFDGAEWSEERFSFRLGDDTNVWFLRWGPGANLIVGGIAPVSAVIPIPSAVWLMGGALILLGLRRRRSTAHA